MPDKETVQLAIQLVREVGLLGLVVLAVVWKLLPAVVALVNAQRVCTEQNADNLAKLGAGQADLKARVDAACKYPGGPPVACPYRDAPK